MLEKWDLSDLYPSEEVFNFALDELDDKVKRFKDLYLDLFQDLDGISLFGAIQDYESIQEIAGRMISFRGLAHYANLSDPIIAQKYQGIQEFISQVNTDLVFFTHDLCKASEESIDLAYRQSEDLKKYRSWIDHVRLFKDHVLSKEMEAYSNEKNLTSRAAFVRLYDELLARIQFVFQGEKCGISEVVDAMSSLDADVRKEAAQALSIGLNDNIDWFVYITNTLSKDKSVEDKYRRFQDPMQERHLLNQIEPEVVEALVQTVKDYYPRIAHKYYSLKAKILKKDKIEYWDRNAPLFIDQDKKIPYEEAKKIVFDAYYNFSPDMANILKNFFENPWIDVPAETSKTSGAFSHPTVPSVHPYILLNYQGKIRDVMTLAHELGHGIHQVLAAKQGYFLSETPLTIAETASVFGEMLTFEYIKNNLKIDTNFILCSKIDDMINTVVRQIAFYEFEKSIHKERKECELLKERIVEIWRETQGKALGPAVRLDSIINNFWAYISHFIHSPFYVYSYAFGDCLVNVLFAHYKETNDKEDFKRKYIDFLVAGGSKSYKELLKPFGFDPTDRSFWKKGLLMIENMIEELESNI